MKHLNPELEKLEQRVAPDLGLGISIGIGAGIVIGGGGGCGCTSYTDSASGSHGSTSWSSCEGNS